MFNEWTPTLMYRQRLGLTGTSPLSQPLPSQVLDGELELWVSAEATRPVYHAHATHMTHAAATPW